MSPLSLSPSGLSVRLADVQVRKTQTPVRSVHQDVAQNAFRNALAGRIAVVTTFDVLDAFVDEGVDLVAQLSHARIVKRRRFAECHLSFPVSAVRELVAPPRAVAG